MVKKPIHIEEYADFIDPPVPQIVPDHIHKQILTEIEMEADCCVPVDYTEQQIVDWVKQEIDLDGDEYRSVYRKLNGRSGHEMAVDAQICIYLNANTPDLLVKGALYTDSENRWEDYMDLKLHGRFERNNWLKGEADVLAVYLDDLSAEIVEIKSSNYHEDVDGEGIDQAEQAAEILAENFDTRTNVETSHDLLCEILPPRYDGVVWWSEAFIESDARDFLEENFFHVVPQYSEENKLREKRLENGV